jgi:hypothetical protein
MTASPNGVTAKARGTTPPYIPFRTFKTFLQDLDEHGIPGRVDNSALKRFSGGVARQLKTGLRFLHLIDGSDHPTDDLRALSGAFGREGWPDALAGLLRSHYSPVLTRIDLEHATQGQLRDAFKAGFGANANDDVLRKSELFFLQAAQEAQIPISKRIPVVTRQRSGSGGARRRSSGQPDTANSDEKRIKRTPRASSQQRQSNPTLPRPTLEAQLLDKFPEFDPAWPNELKAQWFEGFKTLMGMVQDSDGEPE